MVVKLKDDGPFQVAIDFLKVSNQPMANTMLSDNASEGNGSRRVLKGSVVDVAIVTR
jgi:hypothetical protein